MKLAPGPLRTRILAVLSKRPQICAVLFETNQGGDAWAEILRPLPVKLVPIHQSEPNEVRAARVLDFCQSGWVAHDGRQTAFEDEAVSFPHGAHDHVADSVCTGVRFFLADRKAGPDRARAVVYA